MDTREISNLMTELTDNETIMSLLTDESEKTLNGLMDYVLELQHFKDSSTGLWCTDKEPENKFSFFQLK